MKCSLAGRSNVLLVAALLLATICWTGVASAGTLVDDTWQDGERYQPAGPLFVPAPPPYAENNGVTAVDADADGDLESAWFKGGAGTLDPVGAGGPLQGTTAAGTSSTWTTYFTDMEGDEAELANVGDQLLITWVFTLEGVNVSNTSQDFRLAVVDSPGNRMTANGAPGSAAYKGYGMFANMGQTLDHSRPWDVMRRTAPATSSALLSASGSWTSTGDNGTDDGTRLNTGYADDVEYTFTFLAERLAGDQLQVTMRMDEGDREVGMLDNKGWLLGYYTDLTPASFLFDTFSVRPSKSEGSAAVFDTSLFKVEIIPFIVPEPASLVLLSLGGLAMLVLRRRR
jgi:hypothetical protein